LKAPNPVRQNRAYSRRIEFGSSHPDLLLVASIRGGANLLKRSFREGQLRTSLLASLQQTVEAVRGSFVTVAGSAGFPVSAEQLRGVSAALSNKSSVFTKVH
jgi:hypothetical protein